MKKIYHKLVRDNIIDIIERDNKKCQYKILDDEEYFKALILKLDEEHQEFLDGFSIEELADMEEVLLAIVATKGYTLEEFENIRKEKALKNGAFLKKIYLIDVEE